MPLMGPALDRAIRFPRVSLALLCLLLWLPGITSLPPLDRDESRFAQSSRQMLESGDFVDIRFLDEPRYKKPVGIYWLQAATTEIAGFGDLSKIWTYRLASLLGGIAASWLVWWMARRVAPPAPALLGSALFSACFLLAAESTIATTDAVLLACIVATQGALLRFYLAARDRTPAPGVGLAMAGWAALALAVLVKGPVGPAVSVGAAIAVSAWDRDFGWLRTLRPARGLVLASVIVLPWAIAIALQSHGQFFRQSLGTDFAAKLGGGQETHGAPPGYFLLLSTITLWPVTLVALPGVRDAVQRRAEPAQRFLLAWLVSSWLIFELVPTKLPHYILPTYPALALLGTLWLARTGEPNAAPDRWRWIAIGQFLLGAVAIAAALLLVPSRFAAAIGWVPAAAITAALALSFASAWLFAGARPAHGAVAAIAGAAVLYGAVAMIAPELDRLWVSDRLTALISARSVAGDQPPVLSGFTEPSAVFELGTRTRLSDGAGAAQIASHGQGLVAIEDRERSAFLFRVGALGIRANAVGEISGFNYSRGRAVHITLYRIGPR